MEESLTMALVAVAILLIFIVPIYILNIRLKGRRTSLLTNRFNDLCAEHQLKIDRPHIFGQHIFGYDVTEAVLISLKIANEIETAQIISREDLKSADLFIAESNGSVNEIKLLYQNKTGSENQLGFYKLYHDNETRLKEIKTIVEGLIRELNYKPQA